MRPGLGLWVGPGAEWVHMAGALASSRHHEHGRCFSTMSPALAQERLCKKTQVQLRREKMRADAALEAKKVAVRSALEAKKVAVRSRPREGEEGGIASSIRTLQVHLSPCFRHRPMLFVCQHFLHFACFESRPWGLRFSVSHWVQVVGMPLQGHAKVCIPTRTSLP